MTFSGQTYKHDKVSTSESHVACQEREREREREREAHTESTCYNSTCILHRIKAQ